MPDQPAFDLPAAHRYFAADCFNRAWDYVDKPERTPADDQQMLLLALSSLWHWTQRADATPQNLSIGYWQVSRVYCLLGQPENALIYARLSLKEAKSEGVEPFYLGYAFEALARAASLAGDATTTASAVISARRCVSHVYDEKNRKLLKADIATIPLKT
jgi:hypothetical protein